MRVDSLRAAARSLRAPPAARMRILEELRGDLEDLEETLRTAGLTAAEARRRAEALLAPGEDALQELARVHRPLWVRWQERRPVRGGRVMGAALAALALAGAAAALRMTVTPGDVPLFLIPLAGIAVAAAVHAAGKVVRIWIVGESDPTRVRSGSSALLVAAAGASAATGLGVLLELYRLAVRAEAAPQQQLGLVLDWLRRCVVLGAAGIGVALTCGLAWLFFVRHAAGLEQRERRLLGPDLHLLAEREAVRDGIAQSTTRR